MRSNPIRNAFLVVAVLVMIGTTVLLRGYTIQVTRADEAEQVAGIGAAVVEDVQRACRVEARDPDSDAIRDAGLCDSAAAAEKDIEDSPTPVEPSPGATGARGATGFGVDGRDGDNGEPGQPGESVTGPRGEPGESIVGPPGPAGADGSNGSNGADGAPGRGISDAQCGDDGRWTITYTDGTTSDGGLCRTGLLSP